ncbi:MAG: hypothetical protein ABI810_21135 [Sphingomonas bacterium]
MTRATARFGGVAPATLAAGPLFVLGAAISVPIGDPAAAIPVDIDLAGTSIAMMLTGLPVALALLMVFGGMIAVLPNLIGTAMTWLGDRNSGTQLPIFWALAGAAAFAVPIAALGQTWGDTSPDHLMPFVFTGACCALICRRGVVWTKT